MRGLKGLTCGGGLNINTLDEGLVSYKQCFSIYKLLMLDTFELFYQLLELYAENPLVSK